MNQILVGWEPENGREQRAWTEDWTGRESNRTPEKNAMARVGWMDEWRVDWPMHGTSNILKIAVIQSMHRRIHGIL